MPHLVKSFWGNVGTSLVLVNEVILAKASGKAERIILTDLERAFPSITRSWMVMEKLSVPLRTWVCGGFLRPYGGKRPGSSGGQRRRCKSGCPV